MATDNEVSDIIERRNKSRDYMRNTFYEEWTEVFRGISCRTAPIYKRDDKGKDTKEEDKSRTNVAMPDLSIIWRRNVARLTAQRYRLNYTGGDEMIAEMLTGLAAQQYDRADEATHDRRVVMASEAIGFGIGKCYWDYIEPTMAFRKAIMRGNQVVLRDRASIMKSQGAGDDEIQQAVAERGPDMSDEEIAGVVGKSGNEVKLREKIKKYEGPVVKAVFPGDFFWDPDVLSIDDSEYQIEQYPETDLWLQKMVKLTYCDEEGKEQPVFDKGACDDLLTLNPGSDTDDVKVSDLRRLFREALGREVTNAVVEKRLLKRKKFDILESHELDDDGRIWITWVAEKMRDKPLGKMPYPWDLYGQTVYTEHTPLPSMISAVGDSTPRLLRFLYLLHNRTAAQNFDYVTDVLQPLMIKETGTDTGEDVVSRGRFKELTVGSLGKIRVEALPALPPGAFEREAQILRMESLAEPAMNTVDTGTASNPMAGRLATTAVLNAKAADALTQFKIDGRNIYLRKLGQKKLWMNQQAAQDAWTLDSGYHGEKLTKSMQDGSFKQWADQKGGEGQWALSSRLGKTAAIRLDPMEIQEDYQVEPEVGSYLSVDDEIRQDAAMRLQQVATANPGIIDQRKLARFQMGTIRGIGNPDDYILPAMPPNPEVRTSVTVSVKWMELTPNEQAQLLAKAQIQVDPADVAAAQSLHGVKQMADGANAAAQLLSPAHPESDVAQAKQTQ